MSSTQKPLSRAKFNALARKVDRSEHIKQIERFGGEVGRKAAEQHLLGSVSNRVEGKGIDMDTIANHIRPGGNPRNIVAAIADVDAEVLCLACGQKEKSFLEHRGIHVGADSVCGRCNVGLSESEILSPDDLPEIVARLTAGAHVMSWAYSVGPHRKADGTATCAIFSDPGGQIVYEAAADVFDAARLFLSLVLSWQRGWSKLQIVSADKIKRFDMACRLAEHGGEPIAVLEAYEYDGKIYLSLDGLDERARSYAPSDLFVVSAKEGP